MTRGHFSQMKPKDWDGFNKDMKILTGMLYTIVKAPVKPFLPAFYKTAGEIKKDYEPLYNTPEDK